MLLVMTWLLKSLSLKTELFSNFILSHLCFLIKTRCTNTNSEKMKCNIVCKVAKKFPLSGNLTVLLFTTFLYKDAPKSTIMDWLKPPSVTCEKLT